MYGPEGLHAPGVGVPAPDEVRTGAGLALGEPPDRGKLGNQGLGKESLLRRHV